MAESKCWVMNRETVTKATLSVPPGRMSHEDSTEESSNSNLCKNLWSEEYYYVSLDKMLGVCNTVFLMNKENGYQCSYNREWLSDVLSAMLWHSYSMVKLA